MAIVNSWIFGKKLLVDGKQSSKIRLVFKSVNVFGLTACTKTIVTHTTKGEQKHKSHTALCDDAALHDGKHRWYGLLSSNKNPLLDPAVNNMKGKKNNQDMRTIQFCLGMSKWWNDPVQVILKELQNNMNSRGYE
jgi:hypothetical protein